MVPKNSVISLSMTVEEGIKLVVSGGMITPNSINKNQVNATKKSWFRKKQTKEEIEPTKNNFGDHENSLH